MTATLKWLTAAQVAKYCQSYPEMVYRAIRSGELEASNIGRSSKHPCWRVSQDALERWLRSKSNRAKINGNTPARRTRRKPDDVIEFVK